MVSRGKKGELNLSFGMIFSIILIIAFLIFAFYAIRTFLGVQNIAKVADFRENLQSDIDVLWRSSQGTQNVSYSLPGDVEKVCFKDDKYENLIFFPEDAAAGLEPKLMEHIDLSRIVSSENAPLENRNMFCINNVNGKIKMTMKKSYDENLVMITRV